MLSSFINFVSCLFLGKSKPCHRSRFTEYELIFLPFFLFSLKALILIVETILKKINEIYDKKMKALRRKGKAFISLEQTLLFGVCEGMINTMAIRQIMICTPQAVPYSHVLNHKRKKINPIFPWKRE